MRRLIMMNVRQLIVVAGVCVAAACSGSPTDPSSGGPGGSGGNGGCGGGGGFTLTCPQVVGTGTRAQGTLTGTINGAPWTADCIAILVTSPTIISIGGSDLATGTTYQTLGFAGDKVVGTQTIGPLSGLNATLIQGSSGWSASLAQGSGSLVLTSVTNNSATGTFSFSMPPVAGSPATGTKNVSGSFNLTF